MADKSSLEVTDPRAAVTNLEGLLSVVLAM